MRTALTLGRLALAGFAAGAGTHAAILAAIAAISIAASRRLRA